MYTHAHAAERVMYLYFLSCQEETGNVPVLVVMQEMMDHQKEDLQNTIAPLTLFVHACYQSTICPPLFSILHPPLLRPYLNGQRGWTVRSLILQTN
jgi:hypothetical protein